MTGVALALAAGVVFGAFQTVNRRTNQVIDAFWGTFLTLLAGLVVLSAWVLLTEDLGVLMSAPPAAYLGFAAAGVVHFVAGWTLLSLSQQRVGASRTSALVATAPLFAVFLAAAALSEPVTLSMLGGVGLVTVGLVLVSNAGGAGRGGPLTPWFALGAALCWGCSPLFIRWGLEGLPVPLVGVTVGLGAAALTYGAALAVTRRRPAPEAIAGGALPWAAAGGALVAVAVVLQWTAYDLTTIAVAITLLQVATPVVLIAAPLVVGAAERPNLVLVIGAVAVLAGSTVVVLAAP